MTPKSEYDISLARYSEITVALEPWIEPSNRAIIRGSTDAARLFKLKWSKSSLLYKEEFRILYLDRKNGVIGYEYHSVGTDTCTLVSVKQALGIALKCNASGVILAHNHPSGGLQPSQADKSLTSRFLSACKVFELKLLDHLIITPDGRYYSFKDEGEL